MLISSYEHSVDAKGRVFIPAKWREDLGDTIIVTRNLLGKGESRCLFGMSISVWNGILERYKAIAVADLKVQSAMRMLFANACDCELDKQGRILINAGLRAYAGIESEAALIGAVNRIEIWNADVWRENEKGGELDEETLSALAEFGI